MLDCPVRGFAAVKHPGLFFALKKLLETSVGREHAWAYRDTLDEPRTLFQRSTRAAPKKRWSAVTIFRWERGGGSADSFRTRAEKNLANQDIAQRDGSPRGRSRGDGVRFGSGCRGVIGERTCQHEATVGMVHCWCALQVTPYPSRVVSPTQVCCGPSRHQASPKAAARHHQPRRCKCTPVESRWKETKRKEKKPQRV